MRPMTAVVRGCYQTSAAQTGTRFRLQHWRQLRPASFYEHRYPPSCKASRSSWPGAESVLRLLYPGSRAIAAPQGEDNDAQLFAQTRTLWIRQLHGLGFSNAHSTSPLQAFCILAWLWVIFIKFRGPPGPNMTASSAIDSPARRFCAPVGSSCPAHSPGTLPDQLVRECRIPRSSTHQLIASRRSEFRIASANWPSPSARPWCTRSDVPVRCPVLTARPHSGIRCRCQCRRHPDVSPPSGCLRSGSSASSRAVACGSSVANCPVLGDRSRSWFSPVAWVSCLPLHVEFNLARPGQRNLLNLSSGVRPLSFFRTTPPPSIQSLTPEPCFYSGRNA